MDKKIVFYTIKKIIKQFNSNNTEYIVGSSDENESC